MLNRDETYNISFDTVGNLIFSQSKNILKFKGIYVTTDVTISAMLFSLLANLFRSKKFKLVMTKPVANILAIIKQMAKKGDLKGQISKIFNLDQVKEAHKMS